jgi:EpsI family protein
VLILSANFLVDNFGSVQPVELKKPLSDFPLSWKEWHGTPYLMDDEMWDRVGAQEYIMINYQSEGNAPVDFYSAYYEYQRKLGDFVHSPKLCLPGAGWYIEKSDVRKIASQKPIDGVGNKLKINEIVVEKNDTRKLVYYWYQGRGRNFTSEYTAKFLLAFDGVFRRRTDGALVRLITSIHEENTEEEARRTLDEFALLVSNELSNYFP